MLSRTLTLALISLSTTGPLAAQVVWKPAAIDFDEALSAKLGTEKPRWVTSDGYSDNVYRSKTGTVLIRTGIHCDKLGLSPGFYTNTTVEWDLKTETARVVEIANWGGGSYGNGKLLPSYAAHPTPSPRHTYDAICYVPGEDRVYMLLGAYGRMRGREASEEAKAELAKDGERTWAYSFGTGRWEGIEDNVWRLFRCSPYENHLTHWPAENKLLFLDSSGTKYARFDLESRRWEAAELANKSPMRLYNARSAWDSKRSLWVFRLGPQLCTFNPKTATFARLPNCYDIGIPSREEIESLKKSGAEIDPRLRWKGVCYLSKHDRYLVSGPRGSDTAVYDPESGRWEKIAAGDFELPNGYLQYNSELDLVALNYQLDCFTLDTSKLIR